MSTYYYDPVNDLWVCKYSELQTLISYFIKYRKVIFDSSSPEINLRITELTIDSLIFQGTKDNPEKCKVASILETYVAFDGDWFPKFNIKNDESCYIENITDISYSFAGCYSLKSFTGIPKSVTTAYEAFFGCRFLTNISKIENFDDSYSLGLYYRNDIETIHFSGKRSNTSSSHYNSLYLYANIKLKSVYLDFDDFDIIIGFRSIKGCKNLESIYFNTQDEIDKMLLNYSEGKIKFDESYDPEGTMTFEEFCSILKVNPKPNKRKHISLRSKNNTTSFELTNHKEELKDSKTEEKINKKLSLTKDISSMAYGTRFELFRTYLGDKYKSLSHLRYRIEQYNEPDHMRNYQKTSSSLFNAIIIFNGYLVAKSGSYKFESGTIYGELTDKNGVTVNYSLFNSITVSFTTKTYVTVTANFYCKDDNLDEFDFENIVSNKVKVRIAYSYRDLDEYITEGTDYEITDDNELVIYTTSSNCPYSGSSTYPCSIDVDFELEYETKPQIVEYKGDTVCRYFNGEKFYAQPVTEGNKEFVTKRLGYSVGVKKNRNSEKMLLARYIGTEENPFTKSYDSIMTLTNNLSEPLTIPKENFPKGGVIVLCGAKGGDVADGGKGGVGQKKYIYIHANPNEDIVIQSLSFYKVSGNGNRASYTKRKYHSSSNGVYNFCHDYGNVTAYGSEGGIGGNTAYMTLTLNGKNCQISAFGGGGGGGGKATWTGYTYLQSGSEGQVGSYCGGYATYTSGLGGGGLATPEQGNIYDDKHPENGATVVGEYDDYNDTEVAYFEIGVF